MSRKIEDVRSLNDPQRAYKWEVSLPNFGPQNLRTSPDSFLNRQLNTRLGRLAATEINQRASSILGSPLDLINIPPRDFRASFQVEEVQGVPFPGVDREAFYEAGRNTYFPSLEDINSFSIVFYQDASNKIPNYIMQWKRRIINEDGTKNLPKEYKEPIGIKLKNGLNQTVLDVTFKGCFPTQSSGYNLSNQSENLKFTQEFSTDRLIFNSVSETLVSPKDQILDRLERKSRKDINREAGFELLG
ncbi:MAG: hypothetical protein HKO92_06540 [Flavobacteriaceae bacterium]|nr:hypothetical protein [Flavobacteriaceae bacterium]